MIELNLPWYILYPLIFTSGWGVTDIIASIWENIYG